VGAVQDPRKEVLPQRDLFPVRVILRVTESDQVHLVLGPGARDRGARADQISASQQGVGFVQVDGVPEPVRVRFAYVTDEHIRGLSAGWRPNLTAHAAVRGSIPRAVLRQVIRATYEQVWWPSFDRAVYVHRVPVWSGDGYCDPDTGAMLPTWAEALDQLEADPDAEPAHVMRFGRQYDMAGIIAPSEDADRAVRYLAKYLTKAVADPLGDQDSTPAREAHIATESGPPGSARASVARQSTVPLLTR
jgi:hypothetical protein